MSTIAYIWPDCLCVMREKWSHTQPTNTARSLLTGKRYRSIHARERVIASITIDGNTDCGGCRASQKMTAMRRVVQGGRHLMRLKYTPYGLYDDKAETEIPVTQIIPGFDPSGVVTDSSLQDLLWSDGAVDRFWSDDGTDRPWLSGNAGGIGGTAGAGSTTNTGRMTFRDQTPSTELACAGTYVRVGTETVMLVQDLVTDDQGVASVLFMPALTTTPTVNTVTLNAYDEGLFDVVVIPDNERDWTGNASEPWTWEFIQVFPDEIGPYQELDIWR